MYPRRLGRRARCEQRFHAYSPSHTFRLMPRAEPCGSAKGADCVFQPLEWCHPVGDQALAYRLRQRLGHGACNSRELAGSGLGPDERVGRGVPRLDSQRAGTRIIEDKERRVSWALHHGLETAFKPFGLSPKGDVVIEWVGYFHSGSDLRAQVRELTLAERRYLESDTGRKVGRHGRVPTGSRQKAKSVTRQRSRDREELERFQHRGERGRVDHAQAIEQCLVKRLRSGE